MFIFCLFFCCKDTTKSNNRQIFKGKSYYIVYLIIYRENKTVHLVSSGCTRTRNGRRLHLVGAPRGCTSYLVGALVPGTDGGCI